MSYTALPSLDIKIYTALYTLQDDPDHFCRRLYNLIYLKEFCIARMCQFCPLEYLRSRIDFVEYVR